MSTSASARRCASERGGRAAGRVGWCAMVQGFEEDLGAVGVEVTLEDTHPEQRLCEHGGCGAHEWRPRQLRELVIGDAAPMARDHPEVVGAHRLRRAQQGGLVAGVFGSRLRTIGARTSTCAHDTSPDRNASPVASCLRVSRAMPTSFDAATAEIGARCVNHVRGLSAPSSAQSVRACQSPTARTTSAWSRSAISRSSTS